MDFDNPIEYLANMWIFIQNVKNKKKASNVGSFNFPLVHLHRIEDQPIK